MNKYFVSGLKKFALATTVIFSLLIMPVVAENQAIVLKSVKFDSLPDNKLRVSLGFNKPLAHAPKSFTINKSRRISFDMANVENHLSKQETQQIVDQGVLHGVAKVLGSGLAQV